MKKSEAQNEIVIYRGKDGRTELEVNLRGETLWLNLQQIADLFDRDKSVVSRHISNIFKQNELSREAVVAKNATTASDGKTYLVEYFNLDAILSVGYRVNSTRGKRVLVLGPSSTVIEQGLTDKFKELLYGARGAELREKLPERYRSRVVKLLNSNDPIEDGSVVIENINAIYGQENNSIGDTLFAGEGDVLVLSDEVHHAYSHLDFSGDALSFDFEEGQEGKGDDRDERLWMKFLRGEPRIKRHIGFTGTPYSDNDYFLDVLYEYSIKDATDEKKVKWVNPILHTETDEGEAELTKLQRFEQILKTHAENRLKYRYADKKGRSRLKPITVFICKATTSARNNADEFIKVLADYLKEGDPACKALPRAALEQLAREKVICVTSKLGDADYQEKLEEIEQLDPAKTGGQVEFIFAVNKLSEGWDVDNVFQIVPMEERVFNSKLLISQVLGRGLRIPRQVPWVDIQQNFPVVTVTNHEKFAHHITELLDEVTECETRFVSEVFPDSEKERAKYHFNVFNLEYHPSVRIEPRSEEEKSGPAGSRRLELTPCTEKLDVKVVYREDTRRDSVRQHYLFNLLRPTDYPGWFSRLKNGLAVVG